MLKWHISAYSILRARGPFDTILSAAPPGRGAEPQRQEHPGDPSSPPAGAPGRGTRRGPRGHGLDARLHRAGAADDTGARVLLRWPRAVQELAQYHDDELRRARRRRGGLGPPGLQPRLLRGERLDRWRYQRAAGRG